MESVRLPTLQFLRTAKVHLKVLHHNQIFHKSLHHSLKTILGHKRLKISFNVLYLQSSLAREV